VKRRSGGRSVVRGTKTSRERDAIMSAFKTMMDRVETTRSCKPRRFPRIATERLQFVPDQRVRARGWERRPVLMDLALYRELKEGRIDKNHEMLQTTMDALDEWVIPANSAPIPNYGDLGPLRAYKMGVYKKTLPSMEVMLCPFSLSLHHLQILARSGTPFAPSRPLTGKLGPRTPIS